MATRRVVNLKVTPAAPTAGDALAQSVGSASVAGDVAGLVKVLADQIDASRMEKAASMLKADRFQLFSDVTANDFVGVVKSQTDSSLFYACRLTKDGAYSCCTQNLNVCGGLRGALCKHLMVMIVGLAKNGKLDVKTAQQWVVASKAKKPALDKDKMGETFVRYKGAEAGTVDWRPTETIPEDFYAF
jgi:hypothetical protein